MKRSTGVVVIALAEKIQAPPEVQRRPLERDSGNELDAHEKLTIDNGMQVYFRDSQVPW